MFLSVGSNGPSESSLRVLSDRIDSAQDLEVLNYTLNEIKQFASLPELAQSAYSSLIENLKSKKLPEQQVQIIICALNFTGPHDALKEFCLASNNPSDLIVTLRRRLSTSEHNQSPAATHGINLLTALANCADENCAASDSAQKALIRFALGKTTKSFTLAGQQAGIWLAQQLTAQSWTVLADLHSEVRTDPTGHLTLVPAQNKNAAEAKANRIHFEESFKDLSQAAYKNNCTELAYTLITLGVPQAQECVYVITKSALSGGATSERDLSLLKEIALGAYGEDLLLACYQSLKNHPQKAMFNFVTEVLIDLPASPNKQHFVENASVPANAMLSVLAAGRWDARRPMQLLGFLSVLEQLNVPSIKTDPTVVFNNPESMRYLHERSDPIDTNFNLDLISGRFGENGVKAGVYNIAQELKRKNFAALDGLIKIAQELKANIETSTGETNFRYLVSQRDIVNAVISNITILWPNERNTQRKELLIKLLSDSWTRINDNNRFKLAKALGALEDKPLSMSRLWLNLQCSAFLIRYKPKKLDNTESELDLAALINLSD